MDVNNRMLMLVADSLHEKTCKECASDEWHQVLQKLCEQAVQCIPANNFKKLKLNNIDSSKYTSIIGRNLYNYYQVMAEQQIIFERLEKADIPMVVLKGAAAAMNYPHPEHRCTGDIDIIVPKCHFVEAFEVFKEAGYVTIQTLDNYSRHIKFHTQSGVAIELHEYFSSSRNDDQNAILDEYVYNGIKRREVVDVSGYNVPVLPPLENGLVLLAHINQHMSSGLGLRQIIDWMCFVERYLDDTMWEKFGTAAERIGMRRLAIITSYMCKKYLDMQSNAKWYLEIDDIELADELMDYILSHGNFGGANRVASSTVNVIRKFRNPLKGLQEAQEEGCRDWKAIKHYPMLKPFAWIYQIIRWIVHGAQQGVRVFSLCGYWEKEKRETEFLKRLGITKY